jgi:hypothetical protein
LSPHDAQNAVFNVRWASLPRRSLRRGDRI